MIESAPTSSLLRQTFRQRWLRLRTSPRFLWLVYIGLLVGGVLSQFYVYWWDVQIGEMLTRNRGYCERIPIYPPWVKKYLGAKFVMRFEPIRRVRIMYAAPTRPVAGTQFAHSDADDLRLLRGLPFLRELSMSQPLTPSDERYLKWQFGLKSAEFYETSESALDVIGYMPQLRKLALTFNAPVSPTLFRKVAALTKLTSLALYFGSNSATPDVPAVYRELAASPAITRLDIQVHGREQLLALTSPLADGTDPFPELRELRISGSTEIQPADLDLLKKLPSLIHVDLSYSNTTDAHLTHLKQLPYLRTLYLEANPNITNVGVKTLASMTNLQTLNVKRTKITTEGVLQIAKLPRLRCLRADVGGLESRAEVRKRLPPKCELDTN
jgi:Leucine Rich repeat